MAEKLFELVWDKLAQSFELDPVFAKEAKICFVDTVQPVLETKQKMTPFCLGLAEQSIRSILDGSGYFQYLDAQDRIKTIDIACIETLEVLNEVTFHKENFLCQMTQVTRTWIIFRGIGSIGNTNFHVDKQKFLQKVLPQLCH